MTTTNHESRPRETVPQAVKVPIAIAGAIVAVAVGVLTLASAWGSINQRVAAQQEHDNQQDKSIEVIAEKVARLYESQATINAKLDAQSRDIGDIKTDVRMLVRNGNSK